MINHLTLVGRLTSEIRINEKEMVITLAVPRSYRNDEGEYDSDIIPVKLFNGIAQATTENCKQGDVIAIRGRIETKEDNLEIVAEKLTFLSSKEENNGK